MSYNTEYKLTLLTGHNFKWKPHNAIAIIADLRNSLNENARDFFSEDAKYAIDTTGNFNEPCRWYESESELTEFSKKYPDILFILDMFGEEARDIRRDYFHNGNHQEAVVTITYSEFEIKQ